MTTTLNEKIVNDTFNCKYDENQFRKFITDLLINADFSKEQMNFGYRNSILSGGYYVLLEATFKLRKEDAEITKAKIEQNIEFRKNN